MKRILVVTHDLVSPIRGGGGLRTIKTAFELKKRGYNVKVIAPSDRKVIDGISIEQMPQVSKDRFVFDSLWFMFVLKLRLLKNIKYDTIFVHNSVAGIPCSFFSKVFFKRLIYDATDIHTEYLKVSKKGIFIGLLNKIEYLSFKFGNKVIVVSEAMKELLVRHGVNGDKIAVVYDGCELDNFSAEKEKRKYIGIIHHGGIDKQDGVPYIAEAASLVVQKHKNVRFFIVGAGVELENVRKIVDENNLGKYFVFTGWKPYSEMKNYLKKADIGLITRPGTLPNNTILTLKLLEYWATGTAVVSSRLKAIEEVSEEKKDILFFEPDNYKDLAQKIIFLINDKKLLEKMKSNARKKAENFDWDKLIERIADITAGQKIG